MALSSFTTAAIRRLFVTGLIASSALLTGCMTMYVDTATKEVPVAELKKVVQPKPVQLTFEFQTNGAPNAAATTYLKDKIAAQVKASGLFSAVELTPVAGSDQLSVTLNNIPITKDAAAQGFVTGLTFGLAGSAVTDGYVCTVRYLPAGKTDVIVTTAKHAIHATAGNANAPANARKSADMAEAVTTMTREILSNNLRDLAANPNFN
ncbi:MAG: hypothetical protein V4633_02575 [Pseudomonadota bacterium]